MKTIYRLEEKNNRKRKIGRGPYTIETRKDEIIRFSLKILHAHNHGNSHPSLDEDFEDQNISSNYYCGCETLNDLKNWFRGYVAHAKRVGFAIAEYKVMNYTMSESGKQLIFNKHSVISKKYLS